MRREMKLLLIEIGQLRTEVERLRAKEEDEQNVKEFLYRLIESRNQWQREAQRLRALIAKVPPRLLFCGRCLEAFKAPRDGLDYLKVPHSARKRSFRLVGIIATSLARAQPMLG
jgi:hypothetical protein